MAKAPARKPAAKAKPAARKAALEEQFAAADAKGDPSQDELDAIAARSGVTGF